MSQETQSQTTSVADGETLSAVIDKKNEDIPVEIVESENLEGSRVRLVVRVPAETVNEKVEEVLKEFRRQAAMPGFRPGKAPIALVRKRFAKNAKDEAMRRMVTRVAELAAEKQSIEALAQPSYEGWKDAEGAADVTVLLEVRPEIAIDGKVLEDLAVEVTKGEVTDADVDAELEGLRAQNAAFEPCDGAAYELLDGAALRVVATDDAGEKLHDFSRTIEFTTTPEAQLPDAVRDAMVGAKPGETVEVKKVDLSKALGYPFEADFAVTITDLRKRVLPELDDELAKDVSPDFQTLADLKAHIRKELEDGRAERRRSQTVEGIYKLLRERVPFDVPATLVRELANRSLQRAEQQLRQYGSSLRKLGEDFLSNYVQRAQADASVEARNLLLADQVGRFLEIETTDEDLQAEFERIGEAQGRKPLAIRASLEAQNRLESFKADLRLKKVNDILVGKAKITEVEATGEAQAEDE